MAVQDVVGACIVGLVWYAITGNFAVAATAAAAFAAISVFPQRNSDGVC